MANYLAQIIPLENTKHHDLEIVLYCDDLSEIIGLLENPIDFMEQKGKDWKLNDWKLLFPVTAIIAPASNVDGSVPFQPNDFILGESFDHEKDHSFNLEAFMSEVTSSATTFSIKPNPLKSVFANFDEKKGGFIAQFALLTHTLRIHYLLPETDEIGINETPAPLYAEASKFTTPNIICSELETETFGGSTVITNRCGTIHFDLDMAEGTSWDTLNKVRAQFIYQHLIDAPNFTLLYLNDKPNLTVVEKPMPPSFDPLEPVTPRTFNFGQNYAMATDQIVIVAEGLGRPPTDVEPLGGEPIAVCTQSGCTWVVNPNEPGGGHWELNGIIVKNYVAPGM